jgi:hypothetical protein
VARVVDGPVCRDGENLQEGVLCQNLITPKAPTMREAESSEP